MNFFLTLLNRKNLHKHDGRPLWKYLSSDEDFERLSSALRFATKTNIEPRDVTLYFALWWKRTYNGGIPSKQEVFDSLGGNSRFLFTCLLYTSDAADDLL